MTTPTYATISQYVAWQTPTTCADPASRALIIYRRAVSEGFITAGQRIVVWIDLDEVLNAERVAPHISVNVAPPGQDPFAAIQHAELPYGVEVEFTVSDPDNTRYPRFSVGTKGRIIQRSYLDIYEVQIAGHWYAANASIDMFKVTAF